MANDVSENRVVTEATIEEMLPQIEEELLDLCRLLPQDEREALFAKIRKILKKRKARVKTPDRLEVKGTRRGGRLEAASSEKQ